MMANVSHLKLQQTAKLYSNDPYISLGSLLFCLLLYEEKQHIGSLQYSRNQRHLDIHNDPYAEKEFRCMMHVHCQ